MDIILYLLSIIQYLYQQNCWLINLICRYIPLKHGLSMIPILQNIRNLEWTSFQKSKSSIMNGTGVSSSLTLNTGTMLR